MSTFKQYATTISAFTRFQASTTLRALAEQPYDLTAANALTPDRLRKYQCSAGGLKLLYGMQRIDDEVVNALTALATESRAVEQMRDMQAGEVMNYIEGHESQNRAVLHTAMRDFWDQPNRGKDAVVATELAQQEHRRLKAWAEKLDREKQFTHLVMVGIGGSDLGPRALYLALEPYARSGRQVRFIANVDPDDSASVRNGLPLDKTLFCVVSKSGETIETASNEAIVRSWLKDAGLNPADHVMAVTGKGSPMDDTTSYHKVFYMWDYVGGRFSSTSMVGGVLLSFAYGYDVFLELLRGCNAIDKNACEGDVTQNLPLMLALLGVWNHNFLRYPTVAVVPYSQALHRFPAHLQQCDMESNGKRIDRQGQAVDFSTGPVVWGEPGTNAQHSFYQLIHQSTDVVPCELIGFRENQRGADLEVDGTRSQEKLLSNLFAQAIALATGKQDENPNKVFPGNRPSSIILAKKLTPYTLGALLALYEAKIAFQGFIWDINSFDQEGVQLGKFLANKVLSRFAHKYGGARAEEYPLGDALIDELGTLTED